MEEVRGAVKLSDSEERQVCLTCDQDECIDGENGCPLVIANRARFSEYRLTLKAKRQQGRYIQ